MSETGGFWECGESEAGREERWRKEWRWGEVGRAHTPRRDWGTGVWWCAEVFLEAKWASQAGWSGSRREKGQRERVGGPGALAQCRVEFGRLDKRAQEEGNGRQSGAGQGRSPRWEQGWCRPGAWSFGERKPGRASVGAAGPKGDRALHGPGIEPGPPAWQARILPLNHPCTDGSGQQTASPAALPSGGQTRVGASREHLLRGSRRRTGGLKKRLQARPEP